MKPIYLDNAATAPLLPDVIATHTTALADVFGNPSAVNYYGRRARFHLQQARSQLAASINASEQEIQITSGGSEGDNTALLQTAKKLRKYGRHIISTQIEHEAVLKPLHYLEQQGYEVTYLPVDEHGQISLTDLKNALRPDTILVSVMLVNNEVGSIQPIADVVKLTHTYAPHALVHTDAVQAYGAVPIDVNQLDVDLLSVSAHKVNGPKFLGFLYRKGDLVLPSLIMGGDQEQKRRAGTENVPAVMAFATAVAAHTGAAAPAQIKKLHEFKRILTTTLTKAGIDFEVNGMPLDQAAPQIVNLWFKGCRADALLTNLDLAGVIAAAGSACTAGSLEPSHVLSAMYGSDSLRVAQSLRFSFGVQNTAEEVKQAATIVAQVVTKQLAK